MNPKWRKERPPGAPEKIVRQAHPSNQPARSFWDSKATHTETGTHHRSSSLLAILGTLTQILMSWHCNNLRQNIAAQRPPLWRTLTHRQSSITVP